MPCILVSQLQVARRDAPDPTRIKKVIDFVTQVMEVCHKKWYTTIYSMFNSMKSNALAS